MKRYVKNGGAARRPFFAILEKPRDVAKIAPPPPTRAKVKGNVKAGATTTHVVYDFIRK